MPNLTQHGEFMSGKLWGDIFKPGRAAIVAEIGLNHNGDPGEAMAMVEAAARAGADAVKFQTLVPEKLVSVYARDMLAGKKELEADNSTIEFFQKLMLEEKVLLRLRERSEQLGLVFFSAPFDAESVDMLERVGVRMFKIASSEVTNHDLLEYVGEPANRCCYPRVWPMLTNCLQQQEYSCITVQSWFCCIVCHCILLTKVRSICGECSHWAGNSI
jgi:hypothetical protein